MMSTERIQRFRQQAKECEYKATQAATEESQRAWLIVARDWHAMADKEEAKIAARSEAAE